MRVLVIGAGAQARLTGKILRAAGHEMPIVFDENKTVAPPWDCEMVHDEEQLSAAAAICDGFVVCISGTRRGEQRLRLAQRMEKLGATPVSAVHPTAYLADSVMVGAGLQTYPRALVNEWAVIGDYCLLGSNSSVDHDCRVGHSVHVMGAAALASEVEVGDCVAIGTNATVLPGIKIGRNSVVGAGAVVTRHVPEGVTVAGVPARIMEPR